MKAVEGRFARRLSVIVLAKLLVLGALWWVFVRGERVDVDPQAAFAHVVAPAATRGESP